LPRPASLNVICTIRKTTRFRMLKFAKNKKLDPGYILTSTQG
jgi:hypothetical protein